MRHKHDLPGPKEQENKQHAEIKPRIESSSQDVVPTSPESVAVAISPEHDHKATNETAQVAGADVSVEVRHCAEEDGGVPELEFGAREETVQDVDKDRGGGTEQEAEGEEAVDVLAEEALGALNVGLVRVMSMGQESLLTIITY